MRKVEVDNDSEVRQLRDKVIRLEQETKLDKEHYQSMQDLLQNENKTLRAQLRQLEQKESNPERL